MNERMKQLAVQAEVKWQHQEDVIYSTMTLEQFEKFAELIVRECIEICLRNHIDNIETISAGECAYDIQEHFGVE